MDLEVTFIDTLGMSLIYIFLTNMFLLVSMLILITISDLFAKVERQNLEKLELLNWIHVGIFLKDTNEFKFLNKKATTIFQEYSNNKLADEYIFTEADYSMPIFQKYEMVEPDLAIDIIEPT